jgi:nucleoside-diphosphate-sugar epimerase
MNLEIARKTVIVTGAARSIGAAIAERFVAEGASVVLVDINDAEEQAERLRGSGGRALALVADVLEQSSIDRFYGGPHLRVLRRHRYPCEQRRVHARYAHQPDDGGGLGRRSRCHPKRVRLCVPGRSRAS